MERTGGHDATASSYMLSAAGNGSADVGPGARRENVVGPGGAGQLRV